MIKPPVELLEFLYRYDSPIQSLALALRKVVLDEMAPCHEYIFEMRSKVVLVYAATERVIADGICNIGVYRRHVLLGFFHGADLKDPRGLLEGSGKGMRHLSLRALSELERAEIRTFLRLARRHAGLSRPRRRTPDDVVTRVKTRPSKPAWPQLF